MSSLVCSAGVNPRAASACTASRAARCRAVSPVRTPPRERDPRPSGGVTNMMKSVTLLAAFSYVLLWPSGVIGEGKPMTMEEMHRLHQDPNAYVAMLDDPARDAYQKPHDVVMALGLTEGERVADMRSGGGDFHPPS